MRRDSHRGGASHLLKAFITSARSDGPEPKTKSLMDGTLPSVGDDTAPAGEDGDDLSASIGISRTETASMDLDVFDSSWRAERELLDSGDFFGPRGGAGRPIYGLAAALVLNDGLEPRARMAFSNSVRACG